MIFAVAALDDDASQHLLEHALGDPAEAVATAAAHALITHGRPAWSNDSSRPIPANAPIASPPRSLSFNKRKGGHEVPSERALRAW